MKARSKLSCLRYVLIVIGLIFIFGLYPLMQLWPSGWRWEPPQTKYEQMIIGIYATLGIYLLIAAKKPLNNRSLIGFTAWSSIVHATIMLIQALSDRHELAHLYGDIPALYIIGALLIYLMPSQAVKE